MTFNQITYFLEVARQLNFTQAAASLFVTQSTLSRSIASLETELGVTLLERDFHSVRLTPAGELLSKELPDVLEQVYDLFDRARAANEKANGRIVIGVLDGQKVETPLLNAFRSLSDKYPQFSADLKRLYYDELMRELKSNRIQIAQGIVTEDTKLDPDIDYLVLSQSRHWLIAGMNHPIWESNLDLQALQGQLLVVPEDAHPGTKSVKKYLQKAEVALTEKTAPDTETHSLWLESGMGVSICNDNHIIFTSKAFRPLRVQAMEELPNVTVALFWNRKNCTPIVEDILAFIRTGLGADQ